MLSVEELLKPRYKVINIWPGMHLEPFGKDQIVVLQPHKEEDAEGFVHRPYKHLPGNFMWQSFFDLFPHLFQPLEWWMEREIDELPEYVKCIKTPDQKIMPGQFFKVKWAFTYAGRAATGQWIVADTNCYEPATEADYNTYLLTTNQLKDGQ